MFTRQNSSESKIKKSIFSSFQKAEFDKQERKKLSKEGKAEKDGSYPIRNVSDLKNAIQAFGRSKSPEKTKKWIMKRAKELGKEVLLPDNWKEATQEDELQKCSETKQNSVVKKANDDGLQIALFKDINKAHVKSHTKKSKLGKLVNVSEYDTKKVKKFYSNLENLNPKEMEKKFQSIANKYFNIADKLEEETEKYADHSDSENLKKHKQLQMQSDKYRDLADVYQDVSDTYSQISYSLADLQRDLKDSFKEIKQAKVKIDNIKKQLENLKPSKTEKYYPIQIFNSYKDAQNFVGQNRTNKNEEDMKVVSIKDGKKERYKVISKLDLLSFKKQTEKLSIKPATQFLLNALGMEKIPIERKRTINKYIKRMMKDGFIPDKENIGKIVNNREFFSWNAVNNNVKTPFDKYNGWKNGLQKTLYRHFS